MAEPLKKHFFKGETSECEIYPGLLKVEDLIDCRLVVLRIRSGMEESVDLHPISGNLPEQILLGRDGHSGGQSFASMFACAFGDTSREDESYACNQGYGRSSLKNVHPVLLQVHRLEGFYELVVLR